jgi:hypothetical protein
MDDIIHYSRWVDLHYSPDDDGWYAADYSSSTHRTTNVYATVEELSEVLDDGTAKWED